MSDRTYKAVLIPFDPVSEASDDTTNIAISEKTLLLLLALTPSAHWVSRWEKLDGLSDAEAMLIEDWASSAEAQLLAEVTPSGGEECETETPFWEDPEADDADDTEPEIDQSWYGSWDGETFLETLSYVFLTAFLSTLVSPAAAVKFLTVPRTFRLMVRRNPHGAKLLILLDSGIFGLINSYAATPDVKEVIVVSPGTTLMLVHSGEHDDAATPDENGDYVIQVIRSRLTADDVLPPTIRYTDTDPPVFQTTEDGGATWGDAPEQDPRYNPMGKLKALTPYTDIECDVAARMTAQLRDTLNIFISSVDAAQFATGVIALLVFPLGIVGWFLDLFLLAGTTLTDVGQSAVEAAFTEAVYDDITCIFRCYLEPDGQITQVNLDAAYDEIAAAHTGDVANTIGTLRWLYGDVAMSNAGVSRDDTGDCSDCDPCDWIVEYDFTTGSVHGWEVYTDSSYSYGGYNGNKFVGAFTGAPKELFMFLREAGLHLTGWSYFGSTFHGSGGGHFIAVEDITSGGSPPTFSAQATAGLPTAAAAWVTFGTTFVTTNGFGFYMVCDGNGTGQIEILKVRLKGTGVRPSGGVPVTSLS